MAEANQAAVALDFSFLAAAKRDRLPHVHARKLPGGRCGDPDRDRLKPVEAWCGACGLGNAQAYFAVPLTTDDEEQLSSQIG